jgi:hypothetical protein
MKLSRNWRQNGKNYTILGEVSFKPLPVLAENNENSVQTWNPGIHRGGSIGLDEYP